MEIDFSKLTEKEIWEGSWNFNQIYDLEILSETSPDPGVRRAAAAMARRKRRQEDYAASGEWS